MKHLLSFVCITFLLVGCKKENPYNSLIIGKWSLINGTTKIFINNIYSSTDTTPFNAGNFIEFFNNGQYHIEEYFSPNTPFPFTQNGTYKVINDSLQFDGSQVKAKINTLTETTLGYTFKNVISANEYRVSQSEFKK